MRILGIDPGIATIGFGVVDTAGPRISLVKCGVITTPAHTSLASRLKRIYDDMGELLELFKPDAVSIEELFFNTNITTGIAVAHGRGVILLACEDAGVKIFEYTPLQVKQSVVGYGRAEKSQVMDMVRRICGLKSVPRPDDAADAVALALCRMFYHLSGIVAETEPNLAVIDCGGVGYAVNVTHNTLAKLSVGDKVKLYISEIIRDEVFDLYGFADKNERRCFELLLSVSGLGPKAALSILSANTPEGLALAIMNNNEKALTVAPGVGKKIAQRVILELKDKINKGVSEISIPTAQVQTGGAMNDVVAALTVLGYSSSEIAPVLNKLDISSMTTEEAIKTVLRKMTN